MDMAVQSQALVDLVFSWSIDDVINNDLYRDKVKKIPFVFSSESEYLNSFIAPLIEETHADLLSSFTTLPDASFSEIGSIKQSKDYKPPKDLLYDIDVPKGDEDKNDTLAYEPEVGDIIAISSVRPRCVSDLDRPERPYLIAQVKKVKERTDHFKLLILLAKPTLVEDDTEESNSGTLFTVKLTNMTTNVRIWNSLHSDPELANRTIIHNVLQTEYLDAENCTICNSGGYGGALSSKVSARIRFSDLNESQKDAILSCIRTRECHHLNTVKMIWGPPGTGKTKTVGFLLHLLLMMECRTLTCAPTNTAVVQVTNRLVEKVKESAEYGTYGLGDIVLFGNRKRMNIDDFDDLHDVFLDHRADMLDKCAHPRFGWTPTLQAMIGLLKEPEKQYELYLRTLQGNRFEINNDNKDAEDSYINLGNDDLNTNHEKGDDNDKTFKDKKSKKRWKQIIVQMIKENRNKIKSKDGNGLFAKKKVPYNPLMFAEFVKKSFNSIGERLYFFIVNLYTHLPTSVISLEVVKSMLEAVDSLESFEPLLHDFPNEDLKEAYSRGSFFTRFNVARIDCLFILESLPSTFPIPYSPDKRLIREFCLESACLIFCTVSSSAKLHIIDMTPLELLVIDEAAQLKECESTIPLQLRGVRHAILVGDEFQLPAMVRSQICVEAQFGRSLYERLAFLEHKKHLLNVQYRMHPSISSFPNREFYSDRILNGQNVKDRSYNRRFLRGKLYGSYSFINVSYGKEEFDDRRSRKNVVEVAVVSEIISSLYRECMTTRKKVRVGVISPYKAQVHAIAQKIGKYTTDVQSELCVSVRTVDGFQGGEEDVIIISTVRCNGIGSISFLASRQRANVALTRARYCLWILGSGTTLNNSGTFWTNLVLDAKERGCFHDAAEDKSLARAITIALVELNEVLVLLSLDSLLFREARWKVCFSEDFWRSVTRAKNNMFFKKVLNMLEKLSNGWHELDTSNDKVVPTGTSSQLLEYYMVNTQQYLVWAVDIVKEHSHYIQVLKVWDILHESGIPELSKRLDILYESYSEDKLSRCKYKCYDGEFLVPMRWPVDSSYAENNSVQLLSKPAPSISLKNDPETSSTNWRNFVVQMQRPTGSSCSKSLECISLKHETETPSSTNMHLCVPMGRSNCAENDPIKLLPKSLVCPRAEQEISSTPTRNLVGHQRLPVDSSCSEADPVELLSELLASLSLRDES